MALPLAPARTRLPDASRVDYSKPEEMRQYMTSLVEAITVALGQRAPIQSAIPGRLMVSPNGTTYEHSINDAGTVVVTKKADPLP
jgi:hypothetical protein